MKICCKMFSVFLFFSCMHLNAQVNVPGDSLSAPSAFYTHELLLAGGSSFCGHSDVINQTSPAILSRETLYIGKQALFGPVFGFFFSLAGSFIGARLEHESGFIDSFSGAYIGYIIGNACGVSLAGNNKNYTGSFIATLAGAALGAYCGLKIRRNNLETSLVASGLFFGPTIGAIIGFNLFRKPRETNADAKIYFGKGGVSCSFGDMRVFYHCKPVYIIDVIKINF